MSSNRLSRLPPRPLGVCRVLPALLAIAGLAAASVCAAESGLAYSHPIELAAGDFVRAVVEQRADVRVELLDPEGREVLHVDGPYSTRENEEVAAVAERAGLYQLRVLPCPQNAPATACYTLHLDEPRPATGADRRRAEAVRTTQQAVDAMVVPKTEESLRLQLAARKEALGLWSGLGECRREAEELYQLGIVHRLLRQHKDSASLLHEAAQAWAALGDTAREAEALNEAGLSCVEAGHPEDALEDYRLALEKARETGTRRQEGLILNNLGLVLKRLGERRQSLVCLEEALDILREVGDRAEEANTLVNQGSTHFELSETQKALELYKAALDVPAASLSVRAAAYNNLGTLYASLGNWEEAVESYGQAIAINQRLRDEVRLAGSYSNRGLAQHNSGDLEAARSSYEEALSLARGRDLETRILATYNFGLLLDKLERPSEAQSQWREVARLAAEHPELGHIGLSARAAVELGERQLDKARATLGEAIEKAEQKAEHRFAAEMALRLAGIEKERGDLAAGAENARQAIERIESLRNRVSTPDQRALFLATAQSFYATYVDLLMELDQQRPGEGFGKEALRVSEQARARGLLDLLGEAEADLRKGIPPDLLEREQRARAALRDRDLHYMDLVHRLATPEQIAQADEQLKEALHEFETVEAALRARSESYASLVQPRLLSVQEIQRQVLGDSTLLLEYFLGEERSYLWALTAGTFQSFELPGRETIETLARAYYDALTARNDPQADVAQADADAERFGLELSRMILAPVELLLGDRAVLVASDGFLHYVPFVALPLPSSPGERVLARNQVVSLPSASALAALRREVEGRPRAPKTLAVLADPVFPGDPRLARLAPPEEAKSAAARRGLPLGPLRQSDQMSLGRLPFSGEEAKDILAFVPDPAQRLAALGFAASAATAISGELASYRYVHFATHGLIDSRQPKLSKLALSQFDDAGRRVDGFLRLSDIYNLDLNADLVALSACQTALGKEVRGEGLVGLTRGFMYAGSARVLASLWSVEDRATSKLMKSFYRNLLAEKRPTAEALQRAQIEMSSKPQYRSPYFWAAFSMQGEWK